MAYPDRIPRCVIGECCVSEDSSAIEQLMHQYSLTSVHMEPYKNDNNNNNNNNAWNISINQATISNYLLDIRRLRATINTRAYINRGMFNNTQERELVVDCTSLYVTS